MLLPKMKGTKHFHSHSCFGRSSENIACGFRLLGIFFISFCSALLRAWESDGEFLPFSRALVGGGEEEEEVEEGIRKCRE